MKEVLKRSKKAKHERKRNPAKRCVEMQKEPDQIRHFKETKTNCKIFKNL